jgi:hypothetical protein
MPRAGSARSTAAARTTGGRVISRTSPIDVWTAMSAKRVSGSPSNWWNCWSFGSWGMAHAHSGYSVPAMPPAHQAITRMNETSEVKKASRPWPRSSQLCRRERGDDATPPGGVGGWFLVPDRRRRHPHDPGGHRPLAAGEHARHVHGRREHRDAEQRRRVPDSDGEAGEQDDEAGDPQRERGDHVGGVGEQPDQPARPDDSGG